MRKTVLQVILCAVFVILGVIFLAMGINMNIADAELKRVCTEQARGVVADYYSTVSHEGDEEYEEWRHYPIFEYEVDGQVYRAQSPVGKGDKRFDVGARVAVHYNPANPEEFFVPADKYTAKTGGLNIGFGVFMIGFVGFLVVVQMVRRKKET